MKFARSTSKRAEHENVSAVTPYVREVERRQFGDAFPKNAKKSKILKFGPSFGISGFQKFQHFSSYSEIPEFSLFHIKGCSLGGGVGGG